MGSRSPQPGAPSATDTLCQQGLLVCSCLAWPWTPPYPSGGLPWAWDGDDSGRDRLLSELLHPGPSQRGGPGMPVLRFCCKNVSWKPLPRRPWPYLCPPARRLLFASGHTRTWAPPRAHTTLPPLGSAGQEGTVREGRHAAACPPPVPLLSPACPGQPCGRPPSKCGWDPPHCLRCQAHPVPLVLSPVSQSGWAPRGMGLGRPARWSWDSLSLPNQERKGN